MIPDYLNEFKSELEKFKLDTIRILATPIKDEVNLSLTQSKFLGKPYLPISQEYPKNKLGKPMIMWAQINFSEIVRLENYPSQGILQFFANPVFWPDAREEDFCILFHETIDQPSQSDFSFLTKDLYEDCPINCEHSLLFLKETEYGGAEDSRFNFSFNGKSYYDFQENLSDKQQAELAKLFSPVGHKIGGYAYFTQADPREYDLGKKNDLLLLQIDSDGEIMFGDVGVSNFFISASNLKDRDFSKAYFYWDCC